MVKALEKNVRLTSNKGLRGLRRFEKLFRTAIEFVRIDF